MREASVRRAVIAALRERGALVWSQTGAYGAAGRPDLVVCWRGRFIAIELKAQGGRLRPLQAAALDEVRAAGGAAAVVSSAAEAVALLDAIA